MGGLLGYAILAALTSILGELFTLILGLAASLAAIFYAVREMNKQDSESLDWPKNRDSIPVVEVEVVDR